MTQRELGRGGGVGDQKGPKGSKLSTGSESISEGLEIAFLLTVVETSTSELTWTFPSVLVSRR